MPPDRRLEEHAAAVGHQRDRINLCLALPHLGIAALRDLNSYKLLLRIPWSVRLHVAEGKAIDGGFMRECICSGASYDDVMWLNEAAAQAAALRTAATARAKVRRTPVVPAHLTSPIFANRRWGDAPLRKSRKNTEYNRNYSWK